MTPSEVHSRVREELDRFEHQPSSSGHLIGEPWSQERVAAQLSKLRKALVFPYQRDFNNRDDQDTETRVTYWVIATESSNVIFYDESRDEFGLAIGSPDEVPGTINVRGDLANIFMAR